MLEDGRSTDDSVLQQWLEKMKAESLAYFHQNSQGSENNKRTHLTYLNEQMDAVCGMIQIMNKNKRRPKEETENGVRYHPSQGLVIDLVKSSPM